jgi:hypothetical protein
MSYWDRLKENLSLTSPRLVFIGEKEVQNAVDALSALSTNSKSRDDFDPILRNSYDQIVSGCVNQSTKEIIPIPFRMAAIGPVNIPIVVAMLVTPASAVGTTLFLHFGNQTYNSACNYYNRSGNDLSMSGIMKSYGLAVCSACSMAFGLGKVMAYGPKALQKSPWFIPVLASAAAGSSNLGFMRMNEITEGTQVFDKDNNPLGLSKVAGFDGVLKTAVSRCCMVPTAVLIIPSILYALAQKLPKYPHNNPRFGIFLQTLFVYGSISGALPATLAMFPGQSEFKATELESQFHDLFDKDGKAIETVYANKGL